MVVDLRNTATKVCVPLDAFKITYSDKMGETQFVPYCTTIVPHELVMAL